MKFKIFVDLKCMTIITQQRKWDNEKKILIGTKEGRKKHNIDEQNRKLIERQLICFILIIVFPFFF